MLTFGVNIQFDYEFYYTTDSFLVIYLAIFAFEFLFRRFREIAYLNPLILHTLLRQEGNASHREAVCVYEKIRSFQQGFIQFAGCDRVIDPQFQGIDGK